MYLVGICWHNLHNFVPFWTNWLFWVQSCTFIGKVGICWKCTSQFVQLGAFVYNLVFVWKNVYKFGKNCTICGKSRVRGCFFVQIWVKLYNFVQCWENYSSRVLMICTGLILQILSMGNANEMALKNKTKMELMMAITGMKVKNWAFSTTLLVAKTCKESTSTLFATPTNSQ